MSLTITIPGAVNVTTGSFAPAVLTIGVGVPGAAGPQGPAGQGVPAGGTAGQFLQKIDGVNYNTDWVTLNLSQYAPLASPVFTGNPTAPTPALGDNDTSLATTAFVQQELASGTAVAKNLEVYVRNQTGSTIAAGSVVYINGATGNRPTVTLAQANNDANSAQTMGFVKTAIANNGFGYVIVRGEVENLDTSAFTEGAQLYLSPTTAGGWTTTKPSAPQHLVYIGIVVRSHPTQGVILVAVQNGYELDELHDVSITSKTNNDLFVYESSSNLWKNKSIGTLGLATQSYVTSGFAPIAAGMPTSGTIGQVLTKNSGTNYDASWQTIIPGDRYLTTSTSSVTIGLGSKSLTVGTGLSYSSQQDVVISYDASNHMHALVTSYDSGTGAMVVDVQSITGSGTYTAWTVNVGGTTPLQTVEWGEILGVLGDQGDLATALNSKLETSTAASTYAALAGATFTGEVVTPASSTSSAGFMITPGVAPTTPVNGELWATTTDLQVRLNGVTETLAEQSWVTAGFYPLTGNPSSFITSSALTPYALLSGATFTGLVGTVASTTTTAGLNIPHGTAPTTPVNGDVWTTTGGLFWRQNGGTKQAMNLGDTQTVGGNITFSNASLTLGNSTAASTYNLGTGATLNATTKAINIGTAGVSGSTTNITIGSAVSGALGTTTVNGNITATGTTLTLGNSTAASTINVGTGATLSGSTKTINIGTNGAIGSTNVINIGPTATSGNINFNNNSVALGSNSTATTAAADTNSTALATTAFVVGQAGSATPLVDGTAAVGTSLRYARQDHVHPTDTSRAALASPTFTGTPAAPTAAADTNTTQLATTAFVVGQAGSATPLVDGTAAVGTSLRYARQDHVHPTDTTRAALASPAFTGTPTAPTATAGTNTTQIATTAFVQQEVPAASTTAAGKVELATRAEVIEPTSNTLAVTPFQAIDVLMHPGYVQIAQNNGNVTTATSGAGAGIFTTSMTRVCLGPNTATAGSVYYRPQTNGGVAQFMARGNAGVIINFSKKFWMSGRSWFDDTFIGDANNTARVTVGKSATGAGALAQKGIGWQKAGGSAANFFLLAHNGTTLTTVNTNTSLTSLGISGGSPFDWSIYSDGSGNVTMWINDTQVATTSAGPTGNSLGSCVWQEEVDQTVSAATRMYLTTFGGHYYHV